MSPLSDRRIVMGMARAPESERAAASVVLPAGVLVFDWS